MDAMAPPVIGVSPAYFISRFGDRFSARQMAEGLEDIAAMGFDGFQPEVFHRSALSSWRREGAAMVARQAQALGLKASQFVAHFMLHDFSRPDYRPRDAVRDDIQVVLDIMDHFDTCRTVTVPLGTCETAGNGTAPQTDAHFTWLRDTIGCLAETAQTAGCRLALEIMPKAIIGGMDGYLRLCTDLGSTAPGLNFDTGHAWAAGEDILQIPMRLRGRILGTHLCDNYGYESLSLGPGQGTIYWQRLISFLIETGYHGAWDIEIICPPERCRAEYEQARDFIAFHIETAAAGIPAQ